MSNWEQLKKMQKMQERISREEEAATSVPECQSGIDNILPSMEVPLTERFISLAEASFFCNRLREAIELRLEEEADLLDQTLATLRANPAKTEEGAVALEAIMSGTSDFRSVVDGLFELLEGDEEDVYHSCISALKDGHEKMAKAHKELEAMGEEDDETDVSPDPPQ
jgi:hypothetical protein